MNLSFADTEPTMRTGIARRFFAHLRRSLPSLATALVGSACWALVMAASAVTASGGMVGKPKRRSRRSLSCLAPVLRSLSRSALTFARFVSSGKSGERRFAACFLGLSLATIGVTAAIYALDYRQYYSAWHEETFTITWMFQFFFTAAVALIQFAVLGVRLFFPLGFIALFVASLWFARSTR